MPFNLNASNVSLRHIKKKSLSLFYSYAQRDTLLLERLENHLAILKYNGLFSTWHRREVVPGNEWASEIDHRLATSNIILLLVSADYLASGYCYGIEMQRALNMHETSAARVIPIILRAVFWEDAPFNKLEVLPKNKIPVTSWRNYDAALTDIAKGIKIAALELIESSALPKSGAYSGTNLPNVTILPAAQQSTNIKPNDGYMGPNRPLLPQNPSFSYTPYSFTSYSEGTKHPSENYQEAALKDCVEQLKLYPNNAPLYYYKGWVLQMLDRHREAYISYEMAYSIQKKLVDAYYGAANALFADNESNLSTALDCYEKSFRISRSNPFAYISYAIVLKKLGDIDRSKAAFKQACDINPNLDAGFYSEWKHALDAPSEVRWLLSEMPASRKTTESDKPKKSKKRNR